MRPEGGTLMKTRIKARDASHGARNAPSGAAHAQFLERHRAQCQICQHPECKQIEREFLDWTSPRELAETYKLGSYRAVYRHAHALDLFDRRRSNVYAALDRIIERAGEVKVTASAVIAAVRLMAKIEAKGDWVYLKAMCEPEEDDVDNAACGQDAVNSPDAVPMNAGTPSNGSSHIAPAATGSQSNDAREKSQPAESSDSPARDADKRKPAETDRGAPDQVAGLPWPWPKEKIQFARGRRWKRPAWL